MNETCSYRLAGHIDSLRDIDITPPRQHAAAASWPHQTCAG
jgi:hypothetical protein